jgi:hypothetical protein
MTTRNSDLAEYLPEFHRLPPPRGRCHISGLSRTTLCELIAAGKVRAKNSKPGSLVGYLSGHTVASESSLQSPDAAGEGEMRSLNLRPQIGDKSEMQTKAETHRPSPWATVGQRDRSSGARYSSGGAQARGNGCACVRGEAPSTTRSGWRPRLNNAGTPPDFSYC